MKNVLVFPCGTEIGLEIFRSLEYSKHFKCIGANTTDDHGKFTYVNYVGGVPHVSSLDFISEINKIIKKLNIDFIYPAHDSVVLKLAEFSNQLKATVVTSNFETCKICRSKRATYEKFKNIIPVPELFDISKSFSFPVFLKPDIGQGSRGIYKANCMAEAEFYLSLDPTLILMEYLPGKEYTIDCFTNSCGKLLFAEGRERARISGGISVNSKPVSNSDFFKLANSINQNINLRGAWFFQVKARETGELVLMEIAPRIAGTMGLYRAEGINFVQLSLFDRMGIDVEFLNNKKIREVDRALSSKFCLNHHFNSVYIDFDDTIIFNGEVNAEAIKFIYQAKNRSKKIILLSRHKYDINETLAKYAISNLLFDDIIIVDKSCPKSNYIQSNEGSIFIDDSFAERNEVSKKLNIPVFDLDSLGSLCF